MFAFLLWSCCLIFLNWGIVSLRRHPSFQKTNFAGRPVVNGYGLHIWATTAVLLAASRVGILNAIIRGRVLPENLSTQAGLFDSSIAVCVGFGLLGLYDDLAGDAAGGGLRGHLGAFLRGKITSGLIKAVAGLAVAYLGVMMARNTWEGSLPAGLFLAAPPRSQVQISVTLGQTLLVALSANFVNLLDLRPGRALAIFCAGTLISAIVTRQAVACGFAWIAALPFVHKDRAGEQMLGDTGANVLGGLLGVTLLFSSQRLQWGALAILILLTLASEKWSFSGFIQRTPWLNRLDRLLGNRTPAV